MNSTTGFYGEILPGSTIKFVIGSAIKGSGVVTSAGAQGVSVITLSAYDNQPCYASIFIERCFITDVKPPHADVKKVEVGALLCIKTAPAKSDKPAAYALVKALRFSARDLPYISGKGKTSDGQRMHVRLLHGINELKAGADGTVYTKQIVSVIDTTPEPIPAKPAKFAAGDFITFTDRPATGAVLGCRAAGFVLAADESDVMVAVVQHPVVAKHSVLLAKPETSRVLLAANPTAYPAREGDYIVYVNRQADDPNRNNCLLGEIVAIASTAQVYIVRPLQPGSDSLHQVAFQAAVQTLPLHAVYDELRGVAAQVAADQTRKLLSTRGKATLIAPATSVGTTTPTTPATEALNAEVTLDELLAEVREVLHLAAADLWQLIRVAEYNLTGVDPNFPNDQPIPEPRPIKLVHKRGVEESRAVHQRCKEALRKVRRFHTPADPGARVIATTPLTKAGV